MKKDVLIDVVLIVLSIIIGLLFCHFRGWNIQ